jgi:hypothetical protein
MHLADGCSLKETSVRARQAGWGTVSSVALFKRLRASEAWLGWMVQQMGGGTGSGLFKGRSCLAVDATTVCESGPTGSQWRVHWSVQLPELRCNYVELTDIHGGEKFARYPIEQDQLVLGDRGYSNPAGVDSVRQRGGQVLIRVNPCALPLYDTRDGQKIKLGKWLRGTRVGKIRETWAWVKGPENRWHRGRLVAVRRSAAATRRELRRHSGKGRDKAPGKLTRAMARYVLVWTSIPRSEMTPRTVLKHYRSRWQVELVFKRVKSIMGLGQLPKRSDASSRAWLNGKLLVAMLVEKLWRKAELFSPWGYDLPRAPQPLA